MTLKTFNELHWYQEIMRLIFRVICVFLWMIRWCIPVMIKGFFCTWCLVMYMGRCIILLWKFRLTWHKWNILRKKVQCRQKAYFNKAGFELPIKDICGGMYIAHIRCKISNVAIPCPQTWKNGGKYNTISRDLLRVSKWRKFSQNAFEICQLLNIILTLIQRFCQYYACW